MSTTTWLICGGIAFLGIFILRWAHRAIRAAGQEPPDRANTYRLP